MCANFDDPCNNNDIILNSKINDKLEKEKCFRNPLKIGEKFRIQIVNYFNHFMIEIDNSDFIHYFNYRISPQLITHFVINGNICVDQILLVNFKTPKGKNSSKQICPIPEEIPRANINIPYTFENPEIPFKHSIEGGLPILAELIIEGFSFETEIERFEINFYSGNNIAMSLQSCFEPFYKPDKIKLNSFINGKWGVKERHSNPIFIFDDFYIRIVNYFNHFLIDIDDEKLIQYTHRLDPATITHFELKGNIKIQKIYCINFNEQKCCEENVTTYMTETIEEKLNSVTISEC